MYDVDGDGTVSDDELAMSERMQNLSVIAYIYNNITKEIVQVEKSLLIN